MVICRQQQRDRRTLTVADSVCERDDPKSKPSVIQPCGDECSEYVWNATVWRPCPVECGDGSQTRFVLCVKSSGRSRIRVDDEVCSERLGPKPAEERFCDPVPTCQYIASEWSACSVSCEVGVRTRGLSCVKINDDGSQRTIALDQCARDVTLVAPPLRRSCYRRTCPCILPRWVLESWTACSRTCGGGGTQIRDVVCYCSLRGRLQHASDSVCQAIASKPASRRTCGEGQCPCERHRWSTSTNAWEGCSVSCGTGVERRQVTCVCTREGRRILSATPRRCLLHRQPSSQRDCYRPPCPCSNPRWETGNWTDCSATCNGMQTRRVKCNCGGETVDDGVCRTRVPDQLRPSTEQECGGQCPCEDYRYRTGEWSPCSKTCGNGTQSRGVSCLCDLEGIRTVRPTKECEDSVADTRPEVMRSCSDSQCPCVNERHTTGPWSPCSRACGGSQIRIVECRCLIEGTETVVTDDACYFAGLSMPERIKECPSCQYSWVTTHWRTVSYVQMICFMTNRIFKPRLFTV